MATKEQVLENFNHYYMDEWNRCLAKGMSEDQAVDYFYRWGWISDYEYRIFKGEDLPYPINTKMNVELTNRSSEYLLTDSIQLNDALGGKGIETGNLVVIQAPTGEGKTTMMMRLAINAADQNHNVAYISCGEQDLCELSLRFGCMVRDIKYRGKYRDQYPVSHQNWLNELRDNDKKIIDNITPYYLYNDKDIEEIVDTAISKGSKFIFIDYLGCLFPEDGRKTQYLYLTELASSLKNKATDNEVCIITAMQTNRNLLVELSSNENINPLSIDETFMSDSIGVARKATICMSWIRLKGVRHLILFKNRPNGQKIDVQLGVDQNTFKWNELFKPEAGF